ncbi:MAG: LacI family DNA-binding transcriptional regulator [Firmicutes bacterium]|nr:LacI family DNA-binding transcriptional regulator [Bacillota bacterium]
MKRKSSVSSRDVAREAGVSQATVSYILNNVSDVKIKPETRQAVLDAVKKLNYHPNQIARGMKLKKSMSVGVVTDRNVTNFYFMKALEGIRDGLQEDNYSITLLFNKHEGIEEAEFIKYYSSNRIDGIIFAFASVGDGEIEYMDNIGLPYVIVDTHPSGRNVHEVCTDHLAYIQNVIGYFKSKGVQNVAYTGPVPKCRADRRLEAFKNALAFHGYELKEDFIIRSTFDDNEVCKAIKGLFEDNYCKPDAILAGSPRFGMLTVKSCQMLDIKIPEDVRIIAVGSSNFFDLIHPPLSSIELPLYDMGFKAAQMLLEIINGGDMEMTLILPSELILRESS